MLNDWINDVIKKYFLIMERDPKMEIMPKWHEIRVLIMSIFLSIPVAALEKIGKEDRILIQIEECLKKYFVITDQLDESICYIDEYWYGSYLDEIPMCFVKGLAIYSILLPEIAEEDEERAIIFYNLFLLPVIGKFFLIYKKKLSLQEVPKKSSCEFFNYEQELQDNCKIYFSKEMINEVIDKYHLYSLKNEFFEKNLIDKYWDLGRSVLNEEGE